MPAVPTVSMTGAEVRDRVEAAWLGQLVGVNWGWLTEFMYQGEYIPDDKVPHWLDTWAYFRTGYAQDDLSGSSETFRTPAAPASRTPTTPPAPTRPWSGPATRSATPVGRG